jgi:hypothetical protein
MHLDPVPGTLLDLRQPRSQARADQRGFTGSRAADYGNEMPLRDLRLEYIELFVATEKTFMIAILEGSQSYERPFATGKFQVRVHDIVPKSKRAFASEARQILSHTDFTGSLSGNARPA